LEYDVHIESSTYPAQQRCYIMTVHDIGFDHTQYERFVNCEQMTDIRNRVVWIHVNLPGQSNVGTDQRDLEIKKYPTFEELGEELVCVVDQLKIPQVVCMGEGAGASLSVYFALKYPNRCLGLVLIEPIATSPTIFESIKYKLNNLNLLPARFRQNDKLSNIFRRMEKRASFASNKSGENEALHNTSDVKLFDNNNFNLFADSYFKYVFDYNLFSS
jgi:pimeloyl-ACP methyl ester carboxylesterase